MFSVALFMLVRARMLIELAGSNTDTIVSFSALEAPVE